MTTLLPLATRRSRFLFELDAAACLAAPEQSLNAVTGHVATYSRASIKTAVDANAAPYVVPHSLPAFEWATDPVSGLKVPGILLESAATNLMLYSLDLSNAAWTKSGTTITTNTIAGPDGYTTCDALIETATNAEHLVNQITVGGAIADNTVCTMSASVKPGRTIVYVSMVKKDAVTVFGAYFNLVTGVVSSSDAGITARIVAQANGFYRCSVSGSVGAGGTQPQGRVQPQVGSLVYLGVTSAGLYVTDLQFEVGYFPSSRIINAGTALTRSADALTFAFNGLPQAMTLYAKYADLSALNGASANIASISAPGNAGAIELYRDAAGYGGTRYGTTLAAAAVATTPSGANQYEARFAVAAAGSVTFGLSTNGGTESTSTSANTRTTDATFADSVLYVGIEAAVAGSAAILMRSVRVAAGAPTLAQLRQG